MFLMKTVFASFSLLAAAAMAQDLSGVIDLHAHCDPDTSARSIDAIDLAKLARERGMRGIVLKSHQDPTASLAYIVRKEVSGIEVFGGIALNRAVGGINVAAVEHMAALKGGWGRIVWMPTADAENQVRYEKQNRPFVPIARNGALLPEVRAVIASIARHKLVLATGHSSAEEDLLLVSEARRAGIQQIVVTHPFVAPVRMSIPQMKQAAAAGAYLEFTYLALIPPARSTIEDYAAAIRAVGPEHCVISSDLGRAGDPLHPDGLMLFFRLLLKQGFSQADIDRMSKTNPARVLGL
jgi:hypothetical protein